MICDVCGDEFGGEDQKTGVELYGPPREDGVEAICDECLTKKVFGLT